MLARWDHLVVHTLLKQQDTQDNIRRGQNLSSHVQAGASRSHAGQHAQRSCCDSAVRVGCVLAKRLQMCQAWLNA